MVDDIVERFEDPVREPIVAHELPDIFLRIQFRAFGWQRDQRDVRRHVQAAREMPPGLIDENDGVCARRDLRGDFGQVEAHRFAVAPRHDKRRALAVSGTDRPEDVGRCGSLVLRGAWARSALGPTPRDLVLLADTRLVGEPDLYGVGLDAVFAPNLRQTLGEALLKSSMAPTACA